MVNTLTRKMLRDLAQTKGQALSIALVVASGVAVLLASLSTHASLRRAQEDFYAEARFGQVFAELKSAPATLADRLETLPGVAQADTRLSGAMLLDMPGMAEPAEGQLLSLDGSGQPRLNRLDLRSGRFPEPGRDAEVLVNEAFAEAHGLRPGDSVTALLNGRRRTLRVVGAVLSPEYIYAIQPRTPLPDNRRFGVFWMSRSAVAASLDLTGSFNSVVLTLAPGASEAPVIKELDRLLEPYGGQGAFGRDQQRSHRFVSDELAQQRMMAYSIPTIFLGVAAFLLHMVVGRLVSAQREIIATLKALGFGDGPIARHYLGYVGVVVLAGVAGGALFGHWQGSQMSRLYQEYFRFPRLDYHIDPALLAASGLLCLGVAGLGVAGSLRAVAALQPAEAMRPAAPSRSIPRRWDRGPWMAAFTPAGRLAVRGLLRRPWQTLLTSLGIGMAMAVVILGLFWWDGVDLLLLQQFHLAERGDAHLILKRPAGDGALPELARLPGVLAVEGQRMVAVRLVAGHRERLTGLVGLPPEGRLRRLLDADGRGLALPSDGLVLSQTLAQRLELRPGSRVWVEVLEQGRPRRELTVARVVADWVGGAAYAPRDTVNRLMGEGPQFNAAALKLASPAPPGLQEAVNRLPLASGLSLKSTLVRGFRKTTAEHIWVFVAFLVGFATLIAVGVVYNSIRIALSERAWELASLRVLGFTRQE
ncbi:MAG TPA: ABC transporter permease, partial [Holophagaceae bacterium]|nr:ABC transporter permease [Holophagaceae bacterium]